MIALLSGLLLISCSGKPELPALEICAEGDITWDGWTPVQFVANGDTLNARTHFRGGISSAYPKHSLSLKLDEKRELCGLPKDKDWILNANYIDKTFMRHKISYDLFRRMNFEVNRAPLCAYATLSVNGEKQGLYVVMQKLDASTLGIAKKDSSAVIFKEPPLLYEERIVPQDSDNYYQQTFPKKRKQNRTAQIEALRSFLFDSNDEKFRSEAASLLDLDNIADWQLLIMLSNNADGMLKNFFLYKVDDQTPFRVAPWDYDHSFGRDGDNEYNMLSDTVDCNRSVLLRRLMEWPEYRQLLTDRWHNLREVGIVSEKVLNEMIDDNRKSIVKAVKDNEELWPVDGEAYYDGNHFDEEVAIIRTFLHSNIERMDSYFGYTSK